VAVDEKNVMAIEFISISVMPDVGDMELAVELAIDIADMAVVGAPDMSIVELGIDMPSILIGKYSQEK
jgi:hypothetical protein